MGRWIAIAVAVAVAVAVAASCSGEPRATSGPAAAGSARAFDAAPGVTRDAGRRAAGPGGAGPSDASPRDAGPLAAAPAPRPDDWVDVARAIPDAVLDMRYARAENFTGTVLYPVARCLLRRAVAERLVRAAARLRARGRRLLVWDCYRPAALQQRLWDLVRDPRYVAEPRYAADGAPISGSRHSRGAAIDVGLVAADGAAVALPTAHDDFSPAAHRRRARRSAGKAELAILDAALVAEGFVGMPTEWWHYDAPDATAFAFSDVALDAPP